MKAIPSCIQVFYEEYEKNYIFFSLLSIFFHAYNQEIEFKEIDKWIKNNPGELVPIRIEFNDNIDCYKLNQEFKEKKFQ